MRNIERFSSKQMYPYLSLVKRKEVEFYHIIDRRPHVLVHLVKSACLYSVNPFRTLFWANIQHNCPILFGICPTYLPAGLAFRFSFQKQLHLHFWGKWPLAPSIFWTNKLFSQIILQNYQMKSAGIITLMSDPYCGWLAELSSLQPQLHFIQLRHHFQLLLLCSDTSKNMIRIILPFFVNKCQFL